MLENRMREPLNGIILIFTARFTINWGESDVKFTALTAARASFVPLQAITLIKRYIRLKLGPPQQPPKATTITFNKVVVEKFWLEFDEVCETRLKLEYNFPPGNSQQVEGQFIHPPISPFDHQTDLHWRRSLTRKIFINFKSLHEATHKRGDSIRNWKVIAMGRRLTEWRLKVFFVFALSVGGRPKILATFMLDTTKRNICMLISVSFYGSNALQRSVLEITFSSLLRANISASRTSKIDSLANTLCCCCVMKGSSSSSPSSLFN